MRSAHVLNRPVTFAGPGMNDRFSSLVHNALADCALLAVADVLKHRDDHQRRERYLNAVEKNLVDYVIGKLYRPSLAGFVMNRHAT